MCKCVSDSHSLNGDSVLYPCQMVLSRFEIKPKSVPVVVSCALYVHMCFGASEPFYSTYQGLRLTSVTQTANLSKSVSPSVPTRAD